MSKKLCMAFLFFVVLYMVSMRYVVDFLWLIKIIPIALLICGVININPSPTRSILLLALVFSGCGDLFLAFDAFIFGVTAFLFAQLCYAFLFRACWQGFFKRWPLTFLLIMYMLGMTWLLIPNIDNLQIPVIAYLITITAMGLLAFQSTLPIRWAVFGALLFIISDSFIAINKFINPLPFESYWIMSTYYAAQFMLVTGFVNSTKKAKYY